MNQTVKKTNGLCWLWLAVIVFIIDIGSKFLILHNFELYDSINLLSFFSITYVQNFGAAFSLFWGLRWVLALIALVISVFIIGLLYKSPKTDRLANCAYALVLGGALGNLFDRLYHGFVVDFLDVDLGFWRYPTFNIADSAICIGVLLLIISILWSKKNTSKADEK